MLQRGKWILAAGTSLFMIVFALDLVPGLRGGGGWQWLYELPDTWNGVLLLALILGLYCAGLLVLRAR
ncbi:MAG: hypothetical protein H7X77_00505, partial [Anaerolineae bacterium]|nr:hypothetical protein [Anaerolineae bacterium]